MADALSPYRALLSARFRALLQYRVAALAGMFTQLFFGYLIVCSYKALYASTDAPQPMTLEQVISYVWLVQTLLVFVPWAGDPDIRQLVRTGGVAYEMLRPVDLYWMWYSRAVANRTAPALLRCVPLFAGAYLFLGLQAPASAEAAAWFATAVAGAALLSAAIASLMSISLMWTISGEGAALVLTGAVTVFSGLMIPIPLFPDWARPVLEAMPFRGILDTPFRIYVGHIPPERAWLALTHQWIWIALLVGLGRWLVRRATRRLVVQGG